jgi:hypothetical protein
MTNKARFLILATLIAASGVVSTAGFSEGTPEQRLACEKDALRLCRDFVPDIPKITACMTKNRAKLSPRCKAHFK